MKTHQRSSCQEMAVVDILGDHSFIFLFKYVDEHTHGCAGPLPPFPSLLVAWEAGLQWTTPAADLLCPPIPGGFGQWGALGVDLAEERGQGAYVSVSSREVVWGLCVLQQFTAPSRAASRIASALDLLLLALAILLVPFSHPFIHKFSCKCPI